MAKILVVRLSAIGDVAMTIPVIYSAARAYPADRFTVLTETFLLPVFINRPSNVNIVGINTKGPERSLKGLLRFARAYAKFDFDAVLDLHSVMRSMIICTVFRFRGKKVFTIDKGRGERRKLTSAKHKVLKPLKPVTERYADVFRAAGLDFRDTFTSLFEEKLPLGSFMDPKPGGEKWIGIAPFAKHKEKIYPLEMMERVLGRLLVPANTRIFLFGGRGEEQEALEDWARRYPRAVNVAGRYSLDRELILLSHLDLLICMDSANMHFASLVNTKVISVWGATHPSAGFYGYRQDPEDAIQTNLPCRPCSIYGNKACQRGDWACMTQLPFEAIAAKAIASIEN
ncbi:glycosyl transferase family 1 [Bacteroidia bacterium]|nr:glycosyl transferase family 1 [Bacteroidia bacterium]